MEIKNYEVLFMDEVSERLTAQAAALVAQSWSNGAKLIILNGNAFAVHQIKSIRRIDSYEERTLLVRAGMIGDYLTSGNLNCSDADINKWKEIKSQYSIEAYLKPESNNKLLK